MEWFQGIKEWFNNYPQLTMLLLFSGLLIISYLAFLLTNKYVVFFLQKVARKSKTKFDDAIVDSKLITRLSYFIPLLIMDNTAFLFENYQDWITRITHLIMVVVVIRVIHSFLNAVNNYYETMPRSREHPIKGYIQVTIIVDYIFGIIFLIGLLTGQSPWVLMSGVGALTAVILLIFRDTILSFVAGIQITSYNLIQVGDWIEMPQYGADGDVIEIALHTIKVQNWDKTITVIPTHKLTSDAFKNWRGMQQAGGRRIKRALYIDQNSVRFCDETMIRKYEGIRLISDYVSQKKSELDQYNNEKGIEDPNQINRRRMTNLGTFRAYAEAYIAGHPKINRELTYMVRQLAPEPNGLPLEIYAFTNDIVWQNYEAIQSDIFDHLLAVIKEFDLNIFQNPSGKDFSSLIRQK
jgi:miniconductance mechanosensitive channel